MTVGRLERVPLREVWKHEAKNFTDWLEDNIEILNEHINLQLSAVEREREAGSFSADLVAEDSNGRIVIIENQLEKTDHDHLGKILTYLTNIDAKVAVWICSDPRPEHIKAVTWLNESTPKDVSFYLLKVEGVRIGDSPPAPLFTVICSPSEETKEIGEERKEFAQRHIKRLKFWGQLLERSKEKTKLHANISPSIYSWIGAGAGISGLSYNYVITKNWGAAELYIDKGKGSEEINKKIFNALYSKKQDIENDFGEPLEWESLDDRRACRIRIKFNVSGLADNESNWVNLHDKMIDGMIRLEKALNKHIKKLHFD